MDYPNSDLFRQQTKWKTEPPLEILPQAEEAQTLVPEEGEGIGNSEHDRTGAEAVHIAQEESGESVAVPESGSSVSPSIGQVANMVSSKECNDDDIRSWEKRGLVEEFTGKSAFMIGMQSRKKEGTPESIPVPNFREINKYLKVCAVNRVLDGKIQLHLRNMEDGCVMIDIRDAYQGSYIPVEWRKYFVFNCGRKPYNLRRVHFGLRNAPLAMREFLQKDFLMVLRTNNKILMYDDCIACRSKVVAQSVREKLREWGMDIPEPIPIEEWFKKASTKLKINDIVESHRGGEKLKETLKQLLADVVKNVIGTDPSSCIWAIPPGTKVVIYIDGSYQGHGYCFYVGRKEGEKGFRVLEAVFLNYKYEDMNDIEAVAFIKAYYTAILFGFQIEQIWTDSKAVKTCFDSGKAIKDEVLREIIKEIKRNDEQLKVEYVKSENNPADPLTKIQIEWSTC